MKKLVDSMSVVDMDVVRGFKEEWVTQNPTQTDMYPVVFASREGRPIALVISPKIDRDTPLQAANVIARTANPDLLVIITDSFVTTLDKDTHLNVGELQLRWKAGDRKDISEALCCVIAAKDKDIDFISIPYTLEGEKLTWGEERRSEKAEGTIPEVMREIMQAPHMLDNPVLIDGAKTIGIEDLERQLFHLTRASFMFLEENGYVVIDLISERHPRIVQVSKGDMWTI